MTLCAAGIKAARQQRGWTQDDAARMFRAYGLSAWRAGTVGQMEAGLRRPRLDELVLIARALQVTLDELIPGDDELVELGGGAVMTPQGIRDLLSGGFHRDYDKRPHGTTPFESFPGIDRVRDRAEAYRPRHEHLESLLEPIAERFPGLTGADWDAAFYVPSDADRHAGRRLKREAAEVRLTARGLWGRDFTEERDARVGDIGEMEARSRQARRGLVTRGMLAELQASFADEGRPAVVAAVVVSDRGLLVGRRNDRVPPWTLIAGEQEPGERPEDTAIREVKEETGLEIRTGEEIGRRVHPVTGRTMVYLVAKPARGTKVIVGDEAELAEVRWVGLAEADELLPGLYQPVRNYLARELAAAQ